MATASKNRYLHFYPRSPCGERRMSRCTVAGSCRISIHALLAESDKVIAPRIVLITISIHALLAESDCCRRGTYTRCYVFLSTLSLRRATSSPNTDIIILDISIHALLAESDLLIVMLMVPTWYFYPRSPCGERQHTRGKKRKTNKFLSTLSLRRATPGP